jgi:anaerobic nitric oxide reductase flavorubredoxin
MQPLLLSAKAPAKAMVGEHTPLSLPAMPTLIKTP